MCVTKRTLHNLRMCNYMHCQVLLIETKVDYRKFCLWKGLDPSNNWDPSQYEDLGQFLLAWIDMYRAQWAYNVLRSMKFLEQAMSDQAIIEFLRSDFNETHQVWHAKWISPRISSCQNVVNFLISGGWAVSCYAGPPPGGTPLPLWLPPAAEEDQVPQTAPRRAHTCRRSRVQRCPVAQPNHSG